MTPVAAPSTFPPPAKPLHMLAGPVAYGDVVPLDRARHAGCGVPKRRSYAWCAELRAVPVNVDEFGVAGLQLPLAFVRDASGGYDAAAVLALRGGHNAFVDAAGRWNPGVYVPAYLRRYPFCTLAQPGSAQPFLVCVSEAGLEADSATPVISRNGELTAHWTAWLRFIEAYEQARALTRQFAARLQGLDLLVPFEAVHLAGDGRPTRLAGLYRADETRLAALTPGIVREMLRNGEMRALYAHLLSLENLRERTA